MKFAVLDLEWNSAPPGGKPRQRGGKKLVFEIMEIGALMLDDRGTVLGSFHRRIRAEVYRKINPYIAKVTKVKNADLRCGEPFVTVYADFRAWLTEMANASGGAEVSVAGGEEVPKSMPSVAGGGELGRSEEIVLCAWGCNDMQNLKANCDFFGCRPKLNFPSLDIQYVYGLAVEKKVGQRKLEEAVERLTTDFAGTWHEALSDAAAAAMILRDLLAHGVNPTILQRYFIKSPDVPHKMAHITADSRKALTTALATNEYRCPICGGPMSKPAKVRKKAGDMMWSLQCLQHGEYAVHAHITAGKPMPGNFSAKLMWRRIPPQLPDFYLKQIQPKVNE